MPESHIKATIKFLQQIYYKDIVKHWSEQFGTSSLPQGVNPSNTEELLTRLHASKAAIAELKKTQPQAEFELGRFALYTLEEFQAHVKRSFQKNTELPPKAEALEKSAANGTVDWSATNCMNPVLDQGECSAAWVFSTTAAVEVAHCIATGSLLHVSEQDIVSCDRDLLDEGCFGGIQFTAMDWISKNGICLEKDYPYTSGKAGLNGECQSTCKKQKLAVDGHSWALGEGAMEKVLNTQPIAVQVEAGNYAWMFYKSGVVMACPGNDVDHSALVVGYGSDNGVNYFKVRNSWGVNWGDKGYIKLLRGVGDVGTCRVAEYPVYPKIVGTPAPTTKPAC